MKRGLTKKEVEALRLIADGKNSELAGQILGISGNAVRARLKGCMIKLDTENSTHSVAKAFRFGILT